MISPPSITTDTFSNSKKGSTQNNWSWIRRRKEMMVQYSMMMKPKLRMANSTPRPTTNVNDQLTSSTSQDIWHVTKPRISSTELDYSSINCTRSTSPKNSCKQPWRNAAGRTHGLWKKLCHGMNNHFPMIVGALIHQADTVIQAPKPVCHFMAEDIPSPPVLTHWGRVTHMCVGNVTIIGSDNGLSPGRRQAII